MVTQYYKVCTISVPDPLLEKGRYMYMLEVARGYYVAVVVGTIYTQDTDHGPK